MPTEARRIIFSNAELHAALDRHLASIGSSLPAGAITQVWVDDAPHHGVKINVRMRENGTVETLEFPPTQLGSALIGHCVANQIPLPRSFSKALVITGDNVALEITNAPSLLAVTTGDK